MTRLHLAAVLLTASVAALLGAALSADDARPLTALERYGPRLLEIAREYSKYKRPDAAIRWAPELCSVPPAQLNGGLRVSGAKEGTPHAKKLYHLFVKDLPSYAKMSKQKAAPVGQVIVKEAFAPVPLDRDAIPPRTRVAWAGGKPFAKGKKKALFVMFKAPVGSPDSDRGWVYGTVSADGKQVTSAGRVESCMGCHVNAPHDRQYGLPALHAQLKTVPLVPGR